MILSGRRAGALWREVVERGRTLKARWASGRFECPSCGCSTRVAVFEAQTRRTDKSPDFVVFALPSAPDRGPEEAERAHPGVEEGLLAAPQCSAASGPRSGGRS